MSNRYKGALLYTFWCSALNGNLDFPLEDPNLPTIKCIKIRNGAYRYRYAPLSVLRTPAESCGVLFVWRLILRYTTRRIASGADSHRCILRVFRNPPGRG